MKNNENKRERERGRGWLNFVKFSLKRSFCFKWSRIEGSLTRLSYSLGKLWFSNQLGSNKFRSFFYPNGFANKKWRWYKYCKTVCDTLETLALFFLGPIVAENDDLTGTLAPTKILVEGSHLWPKTLITLLATTFLLMPKAESYDHRHLKKLTAHLAQPHPCLCWQ